MKVMRLSPFLQFSCLIINFMTSKMSTVPYMYDWTMQSIRTPDMSKLVIFVWNTFLQCLECFSWGSGSFFQRSLSLPVNVIIQIAQHYLNIKYLGTLQDINIFSCKNKTLNYISQFVASVTVIDHRQWVSFLFPFFRSSPLIIIQ